MVRPCHIYGHGFGSGEMARIEGLGFRLRPRESTFMGAQHLRFIDFREGPSLELIEVTADQAYRMFVPEGMIPYAPGIWLTAYDEPRPVRHAITDHSNGVANVTGLVFDPEAKWLQSLRRLAGSEPGDQAFRLGDLAIWPASPWSSRSRQRWVRAASWGSPLFRSRPDPAAGICSW